MTPIVRPRGYRFEDVLASIALGISRGRHVAINYLNMAGITDAPEEVAALYPFLDAHPHSYRVSGGQDGKDAYIPYKIRIICKRGMFSRYQQSCNR